ncbi:hypothetical protein F9288_07880 [Sphingomonas sp. CL5.1]|uniref:hypothetical protein n=1 Tax=Sphingomonas sp. CL5.1 TaxID=2653203 RepID=UPI001581F00F|nr:hypothetical protein [Sphingomonas sp. CL5.1]QKR99571.1 hypothetical protein F9288_07880 [Sphingomonas sp. CL5.1]
MKEIVALALMTALAAPVAAQTVPAAASATKAGFSVDGTPIETLAGDPRSKAVIDKLMPQLLGHPAYEQFKTMTLAQLAPMSQGGITDELLKQVQDELAKIR